MSDLQLGLLAVGILVVALVLAYNALQERRARRQAEQAFASRHADVLMEGGGIRQEPRLDLPLRRTSAAEEAGLPDPRLDYIIELGLRQPSPAGQVAAHWAAYEHRFAGQARLAGSDDRATWQPLRGPEPCRWVRAALQLASRAGPTSEAHLLEFRTALDSLAAQLPPPGAEFREDAPAPGEAAFGVSRGERGSYVLALEVPRVPEVRRAYEAMVLHARDLCAKLGGTVVDDNSRALDERSLAAIAVQLDEICRKLEAQGIEPGGPAALRLFA